MRHDDRNRWRPWVAAMAAAVLLLGACSSSDDDDGGGDTFGLGGDDADSGGDGGSDDATDDGGSDDDGGSGGDATGGSGGDGAAGETEGGIAFPAGARDLLAEAGLEIWGQRQLAYPQDAFDEIVAFYDEWVETRPGQVVKSEVDGQRLWQVIPEDGGAGFAAITVTPDFEYSAGGELVTFVLLVDGFGG